MIMVGKASSAKLRGGKTDCLLDIVTLIDLINSNNNKNNKWERNKKVNLM